MRIKKAGGKVFGAVLTAAEKKAMDIEINRQIVEADRRYADDIDAMVLYTLHVHLGFGIFQSTRPVWGATANLTILPRQICTKGTKEFLLGRKTHGKKEK